MYAHSSGTNEDEAMKRIWGDNFYDNTSNKWTDKHTGAASCVRGFVKLCYEPLMLILDSCMTNNKEQLWYHLKKHGVTVKDDDKNAMGEGGELMELVMQTWLPASKALLGMIISHLPSPAKAQEYRVENLYKGPLNDHYANAIRTSDPDGPLMVYVSETVPSWQKEQSVSVGRVYSGGIESDMLKRGMMVKIIGPNFVPFQKKDFHIEQIDSVLVWQGKKLVPVQKVHPGNIIVLVGLGLDECIPRNSTVTNEENIHAFPVRAISLCEDKEPPAATLNALGKRNLGQLSLPYPVYDCLFLHQREGMKWLWEMHCNDKKGAILADDMGLGKTRQVCAFLSGLIHSNIIKKALIIAPASVVQQWIPELQLVGIMNAKMFTNSKVHGPDLNTVTKEGGVMLTTYGVFCNNKKKLSGEDRWDYIVMDEGHRAKERTGKISKSLQEVECSHKVIMTGTPLQNNLEEFYTLMKICSPTLLGEYDDFNKNFVGPIDRGKYKDAKDEDKIIAAKALYDLKKIVEPFILRRTKELLKQTGSLKKNKYEYIVLLRLSPIQRQYFTSLVNDDLLRNRGTSFAAIDVARDISRHPFLLLANKAYRKTKLEAVKRRKFTELFKNRLLRGHPLDMHSNDNCAISNKLNFIVYIVPKMIAEGHKILIFSQSPQMLQLIQNALEKVTDKQIIRMDGSTKRRDRDKLRKLFQRDSSKSSPSRRSPSISSSGSSGGRSSGSSGGKSSYSGASSSNTRCQPWVFLMTTRVGGVGLNLTNASRVIIADPADNPSDDNQAVDRAYRIGQGKDVLVYRLMSCGDIEEHIYREQVVKVESFISLMEKDPCAREICKHEGFVMRVPTRGFDHCRTHHELLKLYGTEFEISLMDLKIENKCVLAISNHSLLFSKKERPDFYEMEDLPILLARRGKEKKHVDDTPTPINEITSTHIQITKNVVERLLADDKRELVQMKRASRGAFIDVGYDQRGFPQVLINGQTADGAQKAAELVKKFAREVLSEKTQIIYIPKYKTGLIIGPGGATIRSIKDRSHANVEVKEPLKERKDLVGQKAVIVSGNCDALWAAIGIIEEMLNSKGVPYRVEDGPLK